MAALVKRQVETYSALTAWYDAHYRAHGTWPTDQAYAGAILEFIRTSGFAGTETGTLLDVACGAGFFLSFAQGRFGRVSGCDISEIAVQQARARCPGADVRHANAEELPFPDSAFDVVTCLGALEHFLDPDRALDEIRRVLSPRGVAVILVPTNPVWISGDVQPTEIVMDPLGWSARFSGRGMEAVADVSTDDVPDIRRAAGGCHVYALRRTPDRSMGAVPPPATPVVAGLDPADLECILRRLDENLRLRSMLRDSGSISSSERGAVLAGLADQEDLRLRIQSLRQMRAPLFVLGGPVLSVIAWLCNLPLRLLLRKQVRFNDDLLAVLDGIREQVAMLRRCTPLPPDPDQGAALARQREAAVEGLATELRGQGDWLKLVAAEVRGQAEWIRLLQGRITHLSMDVREGIGRVAPSESDDLPEPRVVDPAEYARKTAAMPDGLRVNLGCGDKPLGGFINVDARMQQGVDIVADIRRLPFEPGSVAELMSAHLVEHFRAHVFRTRVLPAWRDLLREGGVVRIVCPDWSAMLARQGDGRLPLPDFTRITFGGQDYEGNDHFAMYTPETLSEVLMSCGFARTEVVARDRMNAGCPEMEVVGYR